MIGFDGSMNTGLTLRTAQITRRRSPRSGPGRRCCTTPTRRPRSARPQLKARALLGDAGRGRPRDAGRGRGRPRAAAGSARATGLRVLLVDHQDSFVNTLADYFRQQGAEVITLRHGFPAATCSTSSRPTWWCCRPGPGRPADFGCAALLDEVYARRPAGLRRLPGPAGDGRARGRRAGPAARARARQARPGRRWPAGALLAGLPDEFTAAPLPLACTPSRPRSAAGSTVTAAHARTAAVMAIEDREAGAGRCSSTPSRS